MSVNHERSVTVELQITALRISVTDYERAIRTVETIARSKRATGVCAANTQIAAKTYWSLSFRERMAKFDLVVPDGMPLVWCMNMQGAGMKDRVYGPILMREVLRATPRPMRHFFFGGTQECLRALVEAAEQLNPEIQVVGTLSPPFRPWTESDQTEFANAISRNNPDFVWVALGGIKQETWIAENLHRFRRGVFLAVGDAFEVLAGRRRMAPAWMQKAGLGWLFRLWQEPRRLWRRYLVYNTLFIAALVCWALGFKRNTTSP